MLADCRAAERQHRLAGAGDDDLAVGLADELRQDAVADAKDREWPIVAAALRPATTNETIKYSRIGCLSRGQRTCNPRCRYVAFECCTVTRLGCRQRAGSYR